MKYPLYIIINIALISGAWGQGKTIHDQQISVLQNKLKAASADTAKIKLYRKLAEANPDSALQYETLALKLSISIQNAEEIAESYTNLGALYRNQSDYYEAIAFYNKAIAAAPDTEQSYLVQTYLELGIAYLRMAEYDSAEQSLLHGLEINRPPKNSFLEASIYNMMGNVRKDKDDFRQAIEYYLKAVTLFKAMNNKAGLTQAISNIGNVEYVLGNYDKALHYARESLVLAEAIDQKSSIAYSNRLIGRIYRKQQKLDDALAAYAKAADIYKALGAKRDESETYYNTGNIHFEKNDFSKAIGYYGNALAIQKTVPDTLNMAYSYSAIGQAYFQLQKYDRTLRYMDSAAILAERKKLPYILLDVYDYRSLVYAGQQKYERAYQNHRLFANLKDSLTQKENRLAAQEVETRYQTKNKEEEIKALQASNQIAALQVQRKNTQRNYLMGLSALVVVLLAVLYNRYKIKLKATRKLEELDEIKSRFFTNLSHEFRTPLSLIVGPLQERLANITDANERAELELMIRNAQQLSSLVNQLLDLSKLESGNMKLQVREESVLPMLSLLTASFASYADHKGVRLLSDTRHCDEPIFLDPEKVEQVISNLLSNALKFTPAGGEVKLTAHISGQQLLVSVKDTGIGIPSENLPHVFDRFYQVDDSPTRLAGGSGIGLALCKELIELHKGKIAVQSVAGGGSEFTFSIPTEKNAYRKEELALTIEPAKKTPLSPGLSREMNDDQLHLNDDRGAPLILVVEDNADMREFICRVLHAGFRVVAVPDGKEGVEKALDLVPDLIITDLMMPHMDGLTMCNILKGKMPTSHIPVIMLTAKADIDSKLEGLQSGADDYITKPFDSRELTIRVQNLIQQRLRLQTIFREKVSLQPGELNIEKPNEKFLSRLIEILESNYSSSVFGVDQLAEELGISRMQLHRKLKALTDESPGEFIRLFRLQRARDLFLAGGLQVSEVAYATGFNNLSHFTKSFKEFAGSTPSEFMHQNRPVNRPLSEN